MRRGTSHCDVTAIAAPQDRCPGTEPLDRDPNSSSLSFVHPQHPIQLSDAQIVSRPWWLSPTSASVLETFAAALDQTWDFASTREVVERCTDSVLVTDFMSGALEDRDRLDMFHCSLRAVIDMVSCSAIHWRPSGRIVNQPHGRRASTDQIRRNSSCRALSMSGCSTYSGRTTKHRAGFVMDTLGLGALGLPDLQCHFKDLDPGAVAGVLYNLSGYVFLEGDVISDGHTVQGVGAGSKWRCQHAAALVGSERVVLDGPRVPACGWQPRGLTTALQQPGGSVAALPPPPAADCQYRCRTRGHERKVRFAPERGGRALGDGDTERCLCVSAVGRVLWFEERARQLGMLPSRLRWSGWKSSSRILHGASEVTHSGRDTRATSRSGEPNDKRRSCRHTSRSSEVRGRTSFEMSARSL